jgi:hypothetical protein
MSPQRIAANRDEYKWAVNKFLDLFQTLVGTKN